MSYGIETHDGNFITYDATVTHTPTGIQASIRLDIFPDGAGVYPAEAKRDALFQAFLSQVAAMPNTNVVSAAKRGMFKTPVTP